MRQLLLLALAAAMAGSYSQLIRTYNFTSKTKLRFYMVLVNSRRHWLFKIICRYLKPNESKLVKLNYESRFQIIASDATAILYTLKKLLVLVNYTE